MYPSNGIHDTSLFLFSDNMCTNPSSTIEDFSSSSLLNVFPSSHLIDFNDNTVFFQDFHDILHQKVNGQEMDQEMVTYEGASNINMSKIDVKTKKLSCGGSSKLREQIRVKRKCHKDRHSKITTANGSSRGRRMRLPLNVAKEFFALQDMLEFDKASKTVEWLLKKSKNAIKEETTKRANMSHSPCPSTSAIDELEPEAPTSKEKTRVTQRVSATHPVTRGLREKARARARERTQKKKQLQLLGGVTDNDRCRLYNCSQGMNIGSDHPSLNCEKSAAAGDKFLDMGARARERTQKRKQLQLVGGVTDNDRSRQYNCSQGMNIGSDHPSLNCEKSAAAGDKFLDMGARARERTQKRKQLQLVGGVTDNDRSRLYNCSQGMNIGSDHPPLNCEKSAAAGNKFLDMRNGSPAPVLELEGILNYSKQQPHSFEDKTNTEEFTIDHSFFVSNNWDPYTFFNLHHNSTTTFIDSHLPVRWETMEQYLKDYINRYGVF